MITECMKLKDLSNKIGIYYPSRYIYYLVDDGVIVYIGQSASLLSRLGSHLSSNEKKFDSIRVVEVPKGIFLNDAEFIQILINKPKYNGALPTPSFLITKTELNRKIRADNEWGIVGLADLCDPENSEYAIEFSGRIYRYWFNRDLIDFKSDFNDLIVWIDELKVKEGE